MRCDGKQPICDPCSRKAIELGQVLPPSKKYIESLQARIRHLESQLMVVDGQRTFPLNESDSSGRERYESEEDSDDHDGDDDDPFSELIGLVGRLAVVDDGQLHYFGSQSSLNLPRQPRCPDTVQAPWARSQSRGLAAAAQLGALVAVPIELEEHLLDLYWRWQNPWNYIVDKGAFLKSRRGLDDGRFCSPLLLSAIFAISARYSDRPELRSIANDPSTSGNAFCEQAKVLLLYESEAPSVTTVQAAAILALRIMSDGSATRMAHNLGLHMDCSEWVTAGLISGDEAEVRKVTWWGCFVVDNYAPNSKFTISDIEGIVTKADMDLRTYYSALPSHLRLPCSPKIAALPHVYLSHIQYYTHFILLHRPLIQSKQARRPSKYSFASSSTRNVHDTPYLNKHMETCRHSATQISRLMQIFKKHYTLRQIPIASVHLSFAAAVIHLIDARPENPDCDQAIRKLEVCVDSLQDLRTPWCAWADRALRGVHLLALEWYRCNDILQLKSYHDHCNVQTSSSAPIENCQTVFEAPHVPQDVDAGASGSIDIGEISMTPSSERVRLNYDPESDVADTLAFLFQDTASRSDMDDVANTWLAESWHDWLSTGANIEY
ncbi:hypothetical protein D6C84_07817 [Aureobasidium pullulans]|uniref:Xylanolytic transcriptional activator regulatory domain-containing protein n=1 Tax=Aureobasidium pullulans TaxID=5580 RepID=A0A4S9XNL6_AURPU|nr:hypothetical protein D6C84_07817 [Aureobasidium pullulans]